MVLFPVSLFCFSQQPDSTIVHVQLSGAITVTNNGISLIPTFSLGKPAAIFNLSLGKAKLSFDPEFRFSLEGKPWTFLFWWRYRLLNTGKFRLSLGAHPALNFKTITAPVNGDSSEIIITRRFLAGELVPNYLISKKISIGMYYLYSQGFDINVPKHTHFITLNSNISHINLPYNFYMKFTPQVYYLKQDKLDGFYVTAALTLNHKKVPVAFQTIMNNAIKTNITSGNNFVWNASLIYSFNKNYVKQ